jgi:hypothetical protein
MMTFYFTGTGNSLQIARGVGASGELVSIPQFLRKHKESTKRVTIAAETVGLVFPTYWLAVPAIVEEFMERVRIDTKYLYVITTRGNSSLTLKAHLLQIARRNGHVLSYFNKVNMPHNYIPMFDMEKERLRYKEQALKQSNTQMAQDISAHKCNVHGIAGLGFLFGLAKRKKRQDNAWQRT